ncbi:MAG: hypothetical protein NZM25_09330 [Leptospiraceae bacterium]|nr:hypothetical protein [Leptospiraceae bacterium]MDW8307341.1 hypothetical protein [Leptospiraceae bacterium]
MSAMTQIIKKSLKLAGIAQNLFYEFFRGVFKIIIFFLGKLRLVVNRLNSYEYLFLAFMLSSAYFFSRGWLYYELNLGEERRWQHHIISDDFAWFSLFHFVAALPFVVEILYPACSSKELRLAFFLRLFGLSGISFFYLANWFNPSRIAPVTEAKFSSAFYLFGANLLALWITGIWGMVRYAERPPP